MQSVVALFCILGYDIYGKFTYRFLCKYVCMSGSACDAT